MLLAIDCATPYESVALVRDGDVVVEHGAVRRHGAGPTLLDVVQALLDDAGLRLGDVTGLVCGLGPGSFTGLRVALATLKGLALARDLPLWGVPTAVALSAALPSERVVAVIDAKRGEVFVEGRCVPPSAVGDLGEASLLGSGALLYRSELLAQSPRARVPESRCLHHPRAALLTTRLGDPAPLATLEPIYVRKSDAEINYPDGFPDATVVPVQKLPPKRRG
jgi:tRNA threonylcarbamoyladenosine biosynthesis protein TsaB